MTTAAKHPSGLWRQSIHQNYNHRRRKSSTYGAILLTAAKHLHGREPMQLHGGKASARNDDHRRGKAFVNGAITLSAANHLHERGGLSDIGGKASAQATTTTIPTNCMMNQSEEPHEARLGTSQQSNGDLGTSHRRFFNDAFRNGGNDQ